MTKANMLSFHGVLVVSRVFSFFGTHVPCVTTFVTHGIASPLMLGYAGGRPCKHLAYPSLECNVPNICYHSVSQ